MKKTRLIKTEAEQMATHTLRLRKKPQSRDVPITVLTHVNRGKVYDRHGKR